MTAADPAGCLQHYPLPMERFGLNPFGENLYRLVLGSTRRSLVFGKWNESGAPRARYCQTYPQIPAGEWILEKWLSAFDFTGVTAARWNLDPELNALGPYPSRGEYQMIGNTGFNPMDLGTSGIEKLISLVTAGDRHSWAEKLAACRNAADQLEAEKKSLREAIIRDALPAFGHAAFSQLSTGSGGMGKSSPVLRSANDLGLPVPCGTPGQASTGGASIRK